MILNQKAIDFYSTSEERFPNQDIEKLLQIMTLKAFYCCIGKHYLSLLGDIELNPEVIGEENFIRMILDNNKDTDAAKIIFMTSHPIEFVQRAITLFVSMTIAMEFDEVMEQSRE